MTRIGICGPVRQLFLKVGVANRASEGGGSGGVSRRHFTGKSDERACHARRARKFQGAVRRAA